MERELEKIREVQAAALATGRAGAKLDMYARTASGLAFADYRLAACSGYAAGRIEYLNRVRQPQQFGWWQWSTQPRDREEVFGGRA